MNKLQLQRLIDCLDVAALDPRGLSDPERQAYVSLANYHSDPEHGEVMEATISAEGWLDSACVFITARGALLALDAETDQFVPGMLTWQVVKYPSHITQRLRCVPTAKAMEVAEL